MDGKRRIQRYFDRLHIRRADFVVVMIPGKPFRFMGNVYNDGYIENLPRDSAVEVPG